MINIIFLLRVTSKLKHKNITQNHRWKTLNFDEIRINEIQIN